MALPSRAEDPERPPPRWQRDSEPGRAGFALKRLGILPRPSARCCFSHWLSVAPAWCGPGEACEARDRSQQGNASPYPVPGRAITKACHVRHSKPGRAVPSAGRWAISASPRPSPPIFPRSSEDSDLAPRHPEASAPQASPPSPPPLPPAGRPRRGPPAAAVPGACCATEHDVVILRSRMTPW